jgi:phosphoglycerol geranylgeranyltransferase
MKHTIYQSFLDGKQRGEKKIAVLVDPDKLRLGKVEEVIALSAQAKVDYFFIGGSLVVNNMLDHTIGAMKAACEVPIVIFPGSSMQISFRADAILYLSLISGRNPDLLIGKHVETAPFLKISPLEVISCGYMLIDGGVPTTVSYMSNTYPIPGNKDDISVCTALAGEFLGLRLIFMDAGSGARTPVSTSMIEAVSQAVEVPLIVGGGIRTPEKAQANAQAGADVVVVGTAFEHNPSLIMEMASAVHSVKAISR